MEPGSALIISVDPATLVLDRMAKVADLVGTGQPREASGVIVRDGR